MERKHQNEELEEVVPNSYSNKLNGVEKSPSKRLRDEEEEKHCSWKRAKYQTDDNDERRHHLDQNNNSTYDFTSKDGNKLEERHCELCGGGSDGRPPQKSCYEKWDGFGDEDGWLGRLLGPIRDHNGISRIWVHYQCIVWSPEVYFAGPGRLKKVKAALNRGQSLKCCHCRRPGATLGCRIDQCRKTYHLACARAKGCIFDHKEFLMACTDHRHIFQPHGDQYFNQTKKLKAKKMRLEIRKRSNAAQQKNIEEEEKWIGNHDEDEDEDDDEDEDGRFLNRESKKLDKNLTRIAPMYVGGSNKQESEKEKSQYLAGWESVAGLQHVIQCMKELVVLPLLYPELFERFGIIPPRGVLLHGHPGTGKTHVVRALVGSCARGDRRIAYFSRKGADCLGKYVGESERQLKLLFQAAEESQPSIIFFDEIDGLAPCRTRKQDQTHNSVVSTLLALLDGLKSRGCVVVIGATNRPEAVDPALRRPGRFDREIYFPLPSVDDRIAILSLHTKNWPKPLESNRPLLQWIASRTSGFAGADLQALSSQTAIIALKRTFPLKQVLSASEYTNGDRPTDLPVVLVEERDWLEALLSCPPPCSRRDVGMAASEVVSSPLPSHLIPCLLRPLSTLLVALYLDERISLPNTLSKAATIIRKVMVSALNRKKMVSNKWWSHVDDFIQEDEIANKIERKLQGASGVDLFEDSYVGNSERFIQKDSNNPSHEKNAKQTSFDMGNSRGFRILIAGNPRSGQRHLASCIVHCFVDHVQITKVDVATISQGYNDLVQGITQILSNSSRKGTCLVFMPRIDLWAIETVLEDCDSDPTDDQCTKKSEQRSASRAWSLFIDQVESLSLSTPFIILATSEVPFLLLPQEIRHFFRNDLSICRKLTALEHTVPRFSVQVDGIFDHDLIINKSATKLSKVLLKLFVQLIHQKLHINKCQNFDPVEKQTPASICQTDKESTSEHIGATKFSEKSSVRFPPPDHGKNITSSRGKSNLLSAITTFGYQILQEPCFSELCGLTSKLKEGPSADISKSQWKGWKFNSCVLHPTSSLDNVEIKDNYGMVKGLVAVGLSAIRGDYTSLKEVCSDVRAVLHLLVKQINAEKDAGKDRIKYTQILSKAASLEDIVNSWTYMLRSLEQDSPRHSSSISNQIQTKKSTDEKVEGVHAHDVNNSLSSAKFDPSRQSTTVCSINCCPDCLSILNVVTKKILMQEFGLERFDWSAENVHDIVMTLSVDLLTAVRKLFVDGSGSYLFDEKQREENYDKLLESYGLAPCRCRSSRNMITVPIECSCHSQSKALSSDDNVSPLTQLKLNSKFIFSNGVLVDVDLKSNASFNCKFDTLCLSSLVQLIATIKKPFN